jgi:hypothetical protein
MIATVVSSWALGVRHLGFYIDIEGQGKNALDFHIAYYLGEYLTRSPETPCVILSKDRGFDPLIKHLGSRGFSVRRVNTLREASVVAVTAGAKQVSEPASFAVEDGALQWLSRSAKNRRPRTRKALAAHLYSHFSKKMPETEIQKVIERLISTGQLSEANGKVTYHF